MTQVVESSDVVSKLVKFTEQSKTMKEMFGLAFTHPSLLTSQKAHGSSVFLQVIAGVSGKKHS